MTQESVRYVQGADNNEEMTALIRESWTLSRLVENCVFRGVSGELYVSTNLVCFTGENKQQQVSTSCVESGRIDLISGADEHRHSWFYRSLK